MLPLFRQLKWLKRTISLLYEMKVDFKKYHEKKVANHRIASWAFRYRRKAYRPVDLLPKFGPTPMSSSDLSNEPPKSLRGLKQPEISMWLYYSGWLLLALGCNSRPWLFLFLGLHGNYVTVDLIYRCSLTPEVQRNWKMKKNFSKFSLVTAGSS